MTAWNVLTRPKIADDEMAVTSGTGSIVTIRADGRAGVDLERPGRPGKIACDAVSESRPGPEAGAMPYSCGSRYRVCAPRDGGSRFDATPALPRPKTKTACPKASR